jgi:hypothetical protein
MAGTVGYIRSTDRIYRDVIQSGLREKVLSPPEQRVDHNDLEERAFT